MVKEWQFGRVELELGDYQEDFHQYFVEMDNQIL